MELILLLMIAGVGLAMSVGPKGHDAQSAAPASTFVTEDQSPSGKFTTAGEVRPILDMTQAQWIAVRPWDGQDLLYFTNLLAWRCGTHEIRYSVNGGDLQVLETEPCYADDPAPNALKMDGGILPYVTLDANSVVTVEVEILFDDLSRASAAYERATIEIK